MRLWRISNYADLKGIGGTKAKGRWHPKGYPIVYLSEHPSSAMLEILVHADSDPDELPDSYQLLGIEVASEFIVELDQSVLPDDWVIREEMTRDIGEEWITQQASLLLAVPSAIMPHSKNFLLNPMHPDAKGAKIEIVEHHSFDPRLLNR